jgi:hypothetical protein
LDDLAPDDPRLEAIDDYLSGFVTEYENDGDDWANQENEDEEDEGLI